MLSKSNTRAFTLIELSIVLVIIGLIIGGVLVGKALITAAKLRQQISQLNEFNTAINTFRLKYNCLPGDCTNAVSFGLGTIGSYCDNGNGNGIIDVDNAWRSLANGKERFNLWCHLSGSGLVAETYTGVSVADSSSMLLLPDNTPESKIQKSVYVVAATLKNAELGMSFGNGFWLVLDSGPTTTFSGNAMTAITAKSIDDKIDDGIPNFGSVVTAQWYGFAAAQEVRLTDDWNDGCYLNNAAIGVYDINGLRRDSNIEATPWPERPDCSLLIRSGGW